MSRIEEALRRARQAQPDDAVNVAETAEPVSSPPHAAPRPYLVKETVSDPVPAPEPVAVVETAPALPAPVAAVAPPAPVAAVAPPAPVAAVVAPRVEPARAPKPVKRPEPSAPEAVERSTPARRPAPEPDAPSARLDARSEKLILNPELPQPVTEQYRKVAASLHQLQIDRGTKVLMIASAVAGEGKTITASNIALTLSESFKRRVLLIDADLRRPSIHGVFGVPNVTGLSDALTTERPEKLTIYEVSAHLSVLVAGRPNPDPMSSLSSDRMRTIIDEAAARFDWVIIDTPPVGLLADAKLLVEMVQAVVLVIGAGKTPFRAVERAVAAIDRKKIAGVVLNRVVDHPAGYHEYSYYSTPATAG